jgi:ArsR family transcriptional regulator, arsenate/arsenite/antimonite-responsive transcriptional repressor
LRLFFYFHIIGTMKTKRALTALSALAQESRLAVFRLLVKQGPEGLTPGVIAENLDMPPPTLSFHLKALAQSGLVASKAEGRFLRYRADMAAFNALVAFLTEDCCQGQPGACLPENNQ